MKKKYYKKVILRRRVMIIYLVIIISFFFLIVRLSYIKLLKGHEYYAKALDLWTRSAPVKGTRGNIYDRNGLLIVGNTLTPSIIAIPKQIEDIEYTSNIIASIVGCDKQKIKKHLSKNVSVEIIKPEALKITIEEALEITKCNLPGIYVVGDNSRNYPYQTMLAPVVGFTGIDNQGMAGIEYIYDDYLKGKKGALQVFTDAHGALINNLTSYYVNPESGNDVYLTIDLDLQLTVERMLDNIMVQYNPDDAIILVMNPQNSEVLAMGSRPTYDPSHYQDYDPSIYDRNLAIWKAYEAGSTFKIITFSAGLEEKVFRLDEPFFDPGYAIVDGTRLRDWKKGGHGQETFLEVLQNSCNPGFVTIGLRLGKERFFNYLSLFGLGEKTGIDLLGESKGILFNPEKIGNVELATAAFGQGNAVTPIQLVNASMAAVNGGNLYKPYIVKKVCNNEQIIIENNPTLLRRVISQETSNQVAKSLECVVSLGTGRNAYIEGYRIGGKTGTAQIAENGRYVDGKYILSFIGIGPMNNPQLAVYVAITNPHQCIQYGGVVAAPIAKQILMEGFTILNIAKEPNGVPLSIRYYIDKKIYTVDDYIGLTRKTIRQPNTYKIIIEGSGDNIIGQIPEAGEKLIEGGVVILYTD